MAYCRFCGANVEDNTEICMKCGCRVKKNPTQFNQSKILRLMALVFMIITCIALVIVAFALWGIILLVDNYVSIIEIMFDPMSVSYSDSTIKTVGMIISALPLMVLIWAIPMTIHYFKCLKQNLRANRSENTMHKPKKRLKCKLMIAN